MSLRFGEYVCRCALGRSGIVVDKREGDGGTPVGTFPLRKLYYRADRLSLPDTQLPVVAIENDDGWCDDPTHPSYNQLVKLPFSASHEKMWRDDHLYDVVIEIGQNDDPPVPGLGSAVFIHVARGDYEPTEGCVALKKGDLLRLVSAWSVATTARVHLPGVTG